jgi:hypothetical protein
MRGRSLHPESIFGSLATGFGKAEGMPGMKVIMKDIVQVTAGKKVIGKMPKEAGDGIRAAGGQLRSFTGF